MSTPYNKDQVDKIAQAKPTSTVFSGLNNLDYAQARRTLSTFKPSNAFEQLHFDKANNTLNSNFGKKY